MFLYIFNIKIRISLRFLILIKNSILKKMIKECKIYSAL